MKMIKPKYEVRQKVWANSLRQGLRCAQIEGSYYDVKLKKYCYYLDIFMGIFYEENLYPTKQDAEEALCKEK
jgi:hypothetical protein